MVYVQWPMFNNVCARRISWGTVVGGEEENRHNIENDVIKYERTIEDKWFFLSVFPRRQKSDNYAYPRLTRKTAGEKKMEKREERKRQHFRPDKNKCWGRFITKNIVMQINTDFPFAKVSFSNVLWRQTGKKQFVWSPNTLSYPNSHLHPISYRAWKVHKIFVWFRFKKLVSKATHSQTSRTSRADEEMMLQPTTHGTPHVLQATSKKVLKNWRSHVETGLYTFFVVKTLQHLEADKPGMVVVKSTVNNWHWTGSGYMLEESQRLLKEEKNDKHIAWSSTNPPLLSHKV